MPVPPKRRAASTGRRRRSHYKLGPVNKNLPSMWMLTKAERARRKGKVVKAKKSAA